MASFSGNTNELRGVGSDGNAGQQSQSSAERLKSHHAKDKLVTGAYNMEGDPTREQGSASHDPSDQQAQLPSPETSPTSATPRRKPGLRVKPVQMPDSEAAGRSPISGSGTERGTPHRSRVAQGSTGHPYTSESDGRKTPRGPKVAKQRSTTYPLPSGTDASSFPSSLQRSRTEDVPPMPPLQSACVDTGASAKSPEPETGSATETGRITPRRTRSDQTVPPKRPLKSATRLGTRTSAKSPFTSGSGTEKVTSDRLTSDQVPWLSTPPPLPKPKSRVDASGSLQRSQIEGARTTRSGSLNPAHQGGSDQPVSPMPPLKSAPVDTGGLAMSPEPGTETEWKSHRPRSDRTVPRSTTHPLPMPKSRVDASRFPSSSQRSQTEGARPLQKPHASDESVSEAEVMDELIKKRIEASKARKTMELTKKRSLELEENAKIARLTRRGARESEMDSLRNKLAFLEEQKRRSLDDEKMLKEAGEARRAERDEDIRRRAEEINGIDSEIIERSPNKDGRKFEDDGTSEIFIR